MEFYPGFKQLAKRKYTKRVAMKKPDQIKEILQQCLDQSESLWTSKTESHEYIIGYLQGAIKTVIRELD
jgi:hypothetical protein